MLTIYRLCAIFGIPSDTHTWCAYQSDLSSTWGSAAYLFSSVLQWYEAVNKGPVLAFPNVNPIHEYHIEHDHQGTEGDELQSPVWPSSSSTG